MVCNGHEESDMMLYIDKSGNSHVVKVYDIVYDQAGYPQFLIYFNKQWLRKSAKYFTPLP